MPEVLRPILGKRELTEALGADLMVARRKKCRLRRHVCRIGLPRPVSSVRNRAAWHLAMRASSVYSRTGAGFAMRKIETLIPRRKRGFSDFAEPIRSLSGWSLFVRTLRARLTVTRRSALQVQLRKVCSLIVTRVGYGVKIVCRLLDPMFAFPDLY
jgi:hypothetical protein